MSLLLLDLSKGMKNLSISFRSFFQVYTLDCVLLLWGNSFVRLQTLIQWIRLPC